MKKKLNNKKKQIEPVFILNDMLNIKTKLVSTVVDSTLRITFPFSRLSCVSDVHFVPKLCGRNLPRVHLVNITERQDLINT